ncbi:MAG: response regulator transcription factor [Dysgonamonadaceae bacterium]|jgi:DNA-binding NarL/FixJ family response regulator|nr:response regulator transcription factor [Dysgonamonadaceae bacterium]
MHRTFILADNQDITREGLISLICNGRAHKGITHNASTVQIASSCTELMQQLTKNPTAAVVLDYTLFDFSAEQMLNVRQRFPQSAWLLFSDDLSKKFLRQALAFDLPFGVALKTDSSETIFAALQATAAGKVFLCDTAQQVLHEAVPTDSPQVNLTAQEILVLHEIAMGKTTKEIAAEQVLSFHTINTHRKNIFRKLEINNVHEAVKYALRAGILDLAEYYM